MKKKALLLLTVILFTCMAAVPVWAGLPDKAQKAMNLGMAAAEKKDYLQAIRHFQDARAEVPEAPEVLFNIALAESKVPGREVRAIVWFGAYLAAYPYAEKADAGKSELQKFRQFVSPAALGSLIKAGDVKSSPGEEDLRDALTAISADDWQAAAARFQESLSQDPANGALRQSADLAQWIADQQGRLHAVLDITNEEMRSRNLLDRGLIPLFQEVSGMLPEEESQVPDDSPHANIKLLLDNSRRHLTVYCEQEALEHMKIGDLPTSVALLDIAARHRPDAPKYKHAAEKIRRFIDQRELLPDAASVRALIARLQERHRENLVRLIEMYKGVAKRAEKKCAGLYEHFLWEAAGDVAKSEAAYDRMPDACLADEGYGNYTPERKEESHLSLRLRNGDFAGAGGQVESMQSPKDWARAEIEMAKAVTAARNGDVSKAYEIADATLARYPSERERIAGHIKKINGIKSFLLDYYAYNAYEASHGGVWMPCSMDCKQMSDWMNIINHERYQYTDITGYLQRSMAKHDLGVWALYKAISAAADFGRSVDEMVFRQGEMQSAQYQQAAKKLRAFVQENPKVSAGQDERYKQY